MNILYIRGYNNKNKKIKINNCNNCNLNVDIYQIVELNFSNNIKYDYTFKDLYDTMIETVNLSNYNIIIVSDVSLLMLSYYLKDELNNEFKNQIILNLNGFIPNSEKDLEKLIFNLLPKGTIAKSINENIKTLKNAFKESYEELNNNLKGMMNNKNNIHNFLDKKLFKDLSKSVKNQLKNYGKNKDPKDLLPYLENLLSNNIKKEIKELVGGHIKIKNKPVITNQHFNTSNYLLPFDPETKNDDTNSAFAYQSNSKMWQPSNKKCSQFSFNEDDVCMVDVGRHIQHSFNCYSYFLNIIHNDLIDICIQQTNLKNLNKSDRCRNLWPQPGDYANMELINDSKNYTCRNLVNRVLKDHPKIMYIPACKNHQNYKPQYADVSLDTEQENKEPFCNGITKDGNIISEDPNNKIVNVDNDFKCPRGYYKGALVSAPGRSYHFYRKDRESKDNSKKVWSHKDGSNKPKKYDASKVNDITDPLTANRDYDNINYSDMCGYFCIPKNKETIPRPHGRYKKMKNK